MTVDEKLQPVHRLVCGRLRAVIGATVLHENMKWTPVARCRCIVDAAGNTRGLRPRAADTKTQPCHWVVSAATVSETGAERWILDMMKLLKKAHGASFDSDASGKRAAGRWKSGWTVHPATTRTLSASEFS